MTREEAKALLRQKMLGASVPFTQIEAAHWLDGREIRDDEGRVVVFNGDRLADQVLQELRRKGLVSFTRVGRQCLWSPTEAGLALSLSGRA